MEKSILSSIKKLLGIGEDYTNFDTDIILHINSVFMVLHQLGVGPKEGFSITGKKEKWDDFIEEEDNLEAVKSYIHLKVKLLFDPPTHGPTIEAMKETIREFEWRLNVQTESK